MSLLIIGLTIYLAYNKLGQFLTKEIFVSALFLKILSGLLVGYLYLEMYDGGDTLRFYFEAVKRLDISILELFRSVLVLENYNTSSTPRTDYFIKWVALFLKLTNGSYVLVSVYFSLISFLASVYISKVLSDNFQLERKVVFLAFLFLPSAIFWSSGILKDTITTAAVYVYIGSILTIYKLRNVRLITLILSLLSLIILFALKHYLFIGCLLFTSTLLVFHLQTAIKSNLKWVAVLFVLIGFFFLSQQAHPYLTIDRLTVTIYENNLRINELNDDSSKSLIQLHSPNLLELIKEVPEAVQIAVYRPSFSDKLPSWGIIHQLENFLLLAGIFCTLFLIPKFWKNYNYRLFIPALFTILSIGIIIALATPNFGTLVRYKSFYLPFLVSIFYQVPYGYFSKSSNKE